MVKEFVHKNIPFVTRTIGGYFRLTRERQIQYRGRDLLYYIGHGEMGSPSCSYGQDRPSCCIVIGFIKNKKKMTETAPCISEIITIKNRYRTTIENLLKKKEGVEEVIFWF